MNLRINAQISREDRERLDKLCETRGENISTFIRREIKREMARLGCFSEEEKRALGEVG